MTRDLANATESENLCGGHGVTADAQQHRTGVIDVYRGEAKRVGIDACVTLALAAEMLAAINAANTETGLYVCQPAEGGMVTIDAQVSPTVAADILATATRASVPIRR